MRTITRDWIRTIRTWPSAVLTLIVLVALGALDQPRLLPAQTQANVLRGEYGRYRANSDLLYYHLDVRVDPEKKTISGKNTIRFKMLKDDNRVQLDLHSALAIDKILLGETELKFERDNGAVFVDFPETLKAGRDVSIDFFYSGTPTQGGRFGGFTFGKDAKGRHWIYTSCEGQGASVWWPNKDQWRDKVESMDISVAIPNGLVDVSNGKFVGKKDLGDGFTRWDWHVSYPINNYCVSLNIGAYEHFSDKLNDLDMDFYALPEDLERAKVQFAQAKGMLEAFQHYFGEYPFKKDGYKLIQVPYSGMEHQSAVTYGNGFKNGYLGRDWTGVGISPRFDFIIIHESGHEWFGNSVSAADRSDMWIHEGWTTYLESLYVEHHWGKADALKYLNGYKARVQNKQPIIPRRGINASPPVDQYFKGALFINTLRSIVDDDKRWWTLLRDFYQHFKYQAIMTEDVVEFFNKETGKNLTPIFDQYLRHAALPVLELKFDDAKGEVSHRWKADEKAFAMPIRVGTPDSWQTITSTTDWQTLKTPLTKDKFQVATDLYYVGMNKADQAAPPAVAAISDRMRKFIAAKEIAGAVTLVATPDQVLHLDATGSAALNPAEAMLKDAIFWIASMSKPILAALMHMLQDDGLLSVDDPVEKYLPEFKGLKTADGKPAKVTIRHLLTHTSGMGEITGAQARDCKTLAAVIPLYVAKPVAFTPGSKWAYCQSGINTCGRIAEVVTGEPLEKLLERRLFGPLGMKDTTFYLTEKQLPRLAKSYRRTGAGELEAAEIGFLNGKSPTSLDRFPAPNGGLFSTASDYARFCQMVLRGGELDGKRYLKPETVKLMTTIQTAGLKTGFTDGNGWGLGWCVVREPQGVTAMLSPGTFGHGGAYGTQAWIDPVTLRIYILMVQRANFPNSDASDVRKGFQEAASEALAKGKKGGKGP